MSTNNYCRFADIREGCDETGHNCESYDFGNVRNGLIVGLLSIGTLVGAILGAPLADYWGRRRAMTIESTVFIIGVLIQVSFRLILVLIKLIIFKLFRLLHLKVGNNLVLVVVLLV